MASDELTNLIFGDLICDVDQDIYCKSSKRVKLVIGETTYLITGFRKDKYYLQITPMLFQGVKTYSTEWTPGDNILELVKKLLENEYKNIKKTA
tara:strand:+ start:445 stop:726 length:282 start_codon:yes stop_codon:yes gene_type:complete